MSVFIIVEARYDMMSCTQAISFSLVSNTLREQVLCPIPDMSCVWQVVRLLLACGVKGGHSVSAVMRTVVA